MAYEKPKIDRIILKFAYKSAHFTRNLTYSCKQQYTKICKKITKSAYLQKNLQI